MGYPQMKWHVKTEYRLEIEESQNDYSKLLSHQINYQKRTVKEVKKFRKISNIFS